MTTLADETIIPAEDVAPVSGSFDQERSVPAPKGYTDSFEERGRLLQDVWSKHGPGWQVSHLDGTTIHLVHGVPLYRPDVRYAILSDKASRADAQRLNEALQASMGLSLVRYNAPAHRAVVAAMPPYERRLRARIAKHLRIDPWALDLRTTWAPGEDDTARLDTIDIDLHEHLAMDGEKAEEVFREIARTMVDGASWGWKVTADHTRDRFVLTYGAPPVLPQEVGVEPLLPDTYTPDDWAFLPMGVDPDGGVQGLNLKAGPHALVVGPTGSGKSVGLLALITNAVTRGHQLVVIDIIKLAVDFDPLQPWMMASATTLSEGAQAIKLVYAEVQRRKQINKVRGAKDWSALTPEVREAEGIRPMTVLIDEYVSTVIPQVISKALGQDDPLRMEAEEENAAKAELHMYTGKIAREARSVGIFLEVAAQRPDAKFLDGEFRSNLANTVQLAPPELGVERTALGMVFKESVVQAAAEQIRILDDGKSMGLGVVAAEGGTAMGMRVAYTPADQIPAMLDARGVPRAEVKWDLTAPAREETSRPSYEPWSTSRNGAARRKGGVKRDAPQGYNPFVAAAFDRVGAVPWETGGAPVEPPPEDAGWVSAPTAEWDLSAMREPVAPEDE